MEIIRIFALQIEQAVIKKTLAHIYIYCATHAKGVHLGKPKPHFVATIERFVARRDYTLSFVFL